MKVRKRASETVRSPGTRLYYRRSPHRPGPGVRLSGREGAEEEERGGGREKDREWRRALGADRVGDSKNCFSV